MSSRLSSVAARPLTPPASGALRTRSDVQALVTDLVAPVLRYFSPGGARVRLGPGHAWYGEPGDLIEGFARPLWGLAPLIAGGGRFDLTRWRDGLVAGTDPAHPEFWGWPGDYDQRIVEMSPLALALLLIPEQVWEPLPPAARAAIAAWLGRVNGVRPVESNWLFFRVLVNLALRRRGASFSAENMSADLAKLDSFYVGDGWYSDGHPGSSLRDGRVGDYYVPMGMHFYGLLYAALEGGTRSAEAARFAARATRFAEDFIHWFAADGMAIPFGRSLTYRFAQCAFWGALARAGIEALPWPVIKGIYLRHLRAWLRYPIFSESGVLTIGYTYPNVIPAETYNGPGSPYWALKAFLPLALPDDHPFWTADEAPLPKRRAIHTVPAANMVVVTGAGAVDVVALTPGQAVEDWPRHAPQKYSKFAYSTRFGFSVAAGAPTLAEGGFDNTLALSDDRRRYRHRDHCIDPKVQDGVAYSRWLPWPDVEVATWLLAEDGCHVRVHRIITGRALWSAEGGFAVGYTQRNALRHVAGPASVELVSPLGRVGLVEVLGNREPTLVELGVNSHLLYPLSAMPVLCAAHAPGEVWLGCVAYGGGANGAGDATSLPPKFAIAVEGPTCTVTRDGAPWWGGGIGGVGVSVEARLDFLRQVVH